MVRKAKREGKDLDFYLLRGADAPTEERVEELRGQVGVGVLELHLTSFYPPLVPNLVFSPHTLTIFLLNTLSGVSNSVHASLVHPLLPYHYFIVRTILLCVLSGQGGGIRGLEEPLRTALLGLPPGGGVSPGPELLLSACGSEGGGGRGLRIDGRF
jgi:hypothetical protein